MEFWRTKLIRESVDHYFEEPLSTPEAVGGAFRKIPISDDKENLVVFNLNAKNQVVGLTIVSTGTVCSSITHPREVFKSAILSSSSSIIIAHNHPSGDVKPSKDDIKVTQRLIKTGLIVGIELLDHVIVTHKKEYSFRENYCYLWLV